MRIKRNFATKKWNNLFLDIAKRYAQMSLDVSTKVGCVIAQGKFQVSQGFNGFPMGIADTKERLENRELKLNIMIHAEENAILWARKEDLINATLYVTAPPCSRCAVKIIQSGITCVHFVKPSEDFLSRYKKNFELAMQLFKEAEVYCIEHNR